MSKLCPVEIQLSAFLDGELSELENQRIKQHLEGCRFCRQALAELSAADGMVQELEVLEPSPGFERAFWRQIADLEEKQQVRWWQHLLRPGWRPVLATGLAAGLVVGLFFITGVDNAVSLEDRFVAENIDFLNDYEVIRDLDILQNWEALEAMEELS